MSANVHYIFLYQNIARLSISMIPRLIIYQRCFNQRFREY